MSFAVIGPVKVCDFNALSNDIVVGVPAPTAIVGLGHKIERDLRNAGIECRIDGTALIVHSWSYLDGHPKFAPSGTDLRRGKEGASILDEVKGRANVSFVLSINMNEIDPEDQDRVDSDICEKLSENLPGMFFAGGKIYPTRATNESVRIAQDEKELRRILSRNRNGFLLKDRRDILEDLIRQGRDPLDAVLDAAESIPAEKDKDGNTTRFARRLKGWLVPTAVGFQAVEAPKDRRTHRVSDGSYPHAYAEPLTSIGEFKSLRTVLRANGELLTGFLWRHHHSPATATYYASATGKID